MFDEGLHPYISAWSYEALEKSIAEQHISDDALYGDEWDARVNSLEEAIKRLDASGIFGTHNERKNVVI